jgi:hypothetical protein
VAVEHALEHGGFSWWEAVAGFWRRRGGLAARGRRWRWSPPGNDAIVTNILEETEP